MLEERSFDRNRASFVSSARVCAENRCLVEWNGYWLVSTMSETWEMLYFICGSVRTCVNRSSRFQTEEDTNRWKIDRTTANQNQMILSDRTGCPPRDWTLFKFRTITNLLRNFPTGGKWANALSYLILLCCVMHLFSFPGDLYPFLSLLVYSLVWLFVIRDSYCCWYFGRESEEFWNLERHVVLEINNISKLAASPAGVDVSRNIAQHSAVRKWKKVFVGVCRCVPASLQNRYSERRLLTQLSRFLCDSADCRLFLFHRYTEQTDNDSQ